MLVEFGQETLNWGLCTLHQGWNWNILRTEHQTCSIIANLLQDHRWFLHLMTQRPGAAEYLVNAHSMIVKKAKSSSETERKLNAKHFQLL